MGSGSVRVLARRRVELIAGPFVEKETPRRNFPARRFASAISKRLENRGRINSQIKDKWQVKARRHEPNAAPENAVAAFHALRLRAMFCYGLRCYIFPARGRCEYSRAAKRDISQNRRKNAAQADEAARRFCRWNRRTARVLATYSNILRIASPNRSSSDSVSGLGSAPQNFLTVSSST